MNEPPTKRDETITLNLRDFLFICLGHFDEGIDCKKLPPEVALILAEKLKDSLVYKVEFEDRELNALSYPILWWYKVWYNDEQTYYKRKAYAEKQRQERFVLDANVNAMCRAISKETGMSKEQAMPIAYTVIKSKNLNAIKAMGLDKIVEKFEDL